MIAIQQLPAAWLGEATNFAPLRVIRICARCPDRAAAEAIAAANGHETTHGYCEACFAATMAEISAYQQTKVS